MDARGRVWHLGRVPALVVLAIAGAAMAPGRLWAGEPPARLWAGEAGEAGDAVPLPPSSGDEEGVALSSASADWSGASALSDPEATGDVREPSFGDEPTSRSRLRQHRAESGLPSWGSGSQGGRPDQEASSFGARSNEPSNSAQPGLHPAEATPTDSRAPGCAPESTNSRAAADSSTNLGSTGPALEGPIAGEERDVPGMRAPWLSAGARSLLPRLSLVFAATHGPAGTGLLGYVTATFTVDRTPLTTSSRTTLARMVARQRLAAALPTAALERLVNEGCVAPAERQALLDTLLK